MKSLMVLVLFVTLAACGSAPANPDGAAQIRSADEQLLNQGDRVSWMRTHRGTHQADFIGVPASGRIVVWRDLVVTRFEAGRIAEEWAVSDLGERLRTS